MLGRSVRTSQPQGPARVDWSNPICRGLVFALNPASKQAFGGVFPLKPLRPMPGAIAYKYDSTSDNAIIPLNTPLTGANITLFGLASRPSLSAISVLFGIRTGDGCHQLLFDSFGSGSKLGLNAPGAPDNNSGLTFPADAILHSFSSVARSGSITYQIDKTTTTNATTVTSSTFNEVELFSRLTRGDTSVIGSSLALGCVWSRPLSDLEIRSLHDNPWQLFTSDSKALWVPAAASVSLPTLVQPSSTTSAGAWTATGAATLHAAINELIPSDTQYISVNSASTTELVLAEAAYPGAANQTLAYRASSTQGSTLTVTLKQGVTTIMTRTHALTGTDTLYTQTLTSGEIALITAGPISVTLTTS